MLLIHRGGRRSLQRNLAAPRGLTETPHRATVCYMNRITHREMRNNSGEILRRVAAGESIEVTNNGRVAAVLVPPRRDTLEDLVARGEVRPARAPISTLASIEPVDSPVSTKEILDDLKGRW